MHSLSLPPLNTNTKSDFDWILIIHDFPLHSYQQCAKFKFNPFILYYPKILLIKRKRIRTL